MGQTFSADMQTVDNAQSGAHSATGAVRPSLSNLRRHSQNPTVDQKDSLKALHGMYGYMRPQRPTVPTAPTVPSAGTGVTTRSGAQKELIASLMPTKSNLIAAYQGIQHMLNFAKAQENDDTQDWHWGFGAPTNYFTALNYMASNEAFVSMSLRKYGVQFFTKSETGQALTPSEKAYLVAMLDVLKVVSAMRELEAKAPRWMFDEQYGSEFATW